MENTSIVSHLDFGWQKDLIFDFGFEEKMKSNLWTRLGMNSFFFWLLKDFTVPTNDFIKTPFGPSQRRQGRLPFTHWPDVFLFLLFARVPLPANDSQCLFGVLFWKQENEYGGYVWWGWAVTNRTGTPKSSILFQYRRRWQTIYILQQECICLRKPVIKIYITFPILLQEMISWIF